MTFSRPPIYSLPHYLKGIFSTIPIPEKNNKPLFPGWLDESKGVKSSRQLLLPRHIFGLTHGRNGNKRLMKIVKKGELLVMELWKVF